LLEIKYTSENSSVHEGDTMKSKLNFLLTGGRVLILLSLLFTLNLVNAEDSQMIQVCGGDEQLVISCFGDNELNSFTDGNNIGVPAERIEEDGYLRKDYSFIYMMFGFSLLAILMIFFFFAYLQKRKV